MSKKHRFSRFDQKSCIFFVCSLSPRINIYACPNFRTICTMALMNSQRFRQYHSTVMLVNYGNSSFIIIRQNFFPVSFSSRIS